MNRLGIESLTTFSLPPADLVHLAADLDCGFIATGVRTIAANPEVYAEWSLHDPATLRATKTAMADRGVAIGLGQGFGIVAGKDVADKAGDLDILRELGVRTLCAVSVDPDPGRSLDQLARLAEMAGAAGADIVLEFVPTCCIPDLASALRVLTKIAAGNMRLLIDTMHLVRSGGGAADIAALDPGLIGYVQLSDAPLTQSMPGYLEEASSERMAPGAGELPLADILAALPAGVPIGLEVPMLSRALAGQGPHRRARECVEGARRLLAQNVEIAPGAGATRI